MFLVDICCFSCEGCDVAAHAARLRAIHGEVIGGGATEEAQASRAALVNTLVQVTAAATSTRKAVAIIHVVDGIS